MAKKSTKQKRAPGKKTRAKHEVRAIVSREYRESVEKLVKDPVIVKMARETPAGVDTESWNFVRGAFDEYRRRGGKIKTHIGGPAEAIKKLKKIRSKQQTGKEKKETVESIIEWLGFEVSAEDEDSTSYYNKDGSMIYLVEIVDMWSATGDKSGKKYSVSLLEIEEDDLEDPERMSPVLSETGMSLKGWKKLDTKHKAYDVMRNGMFSEFIGDYNTRLEAWKDIRQRLHPHLIFD